MKKILITGVNSYVGNSFGKWMKQYKGQYELKFISLRDGSWKNVDFSQFDSILHVAGIAHVSTDPKLKELYYKVNRDLTIDIAKKAKAEGVKQFIFLSSIIVYGDDIGNDGVITKHTVPRPSNFYGDSKLQAEKGIKPMQDKAFQVVIVRPPMIYGKDSKGNYPRLAKLARITPVFPNFKNKRSMIHIDNLSEFLRLIIENKEHGLFFPQNEEYVVTSRMAKAIAEVHNKRMWLIKIANPLIRLLVSRVDVVNKVFGNMVYDHELSSYIESYQSNDLYESIIATELENEL